MDKPVNLKDAKPRKRVRGRVKGTGPRATLMAEAAGLHKQGRYDAALERWTELRREEPRLRAALLGAIRSAQAAHRADIVETLMAEGSTLFPRSVSRMQKVAQRAGVGLDEGAAAEDEAAWQARQAEPPANGDAELKLALASLKTKRARKGAAGQRRMAAVLPRVEAVVARYPGHSRARMMHVGLLSSLSRFREAAKAAAAYRQELPGLERLVLAQAAALEECQDHDAALAALAGEEGAPPSPRMRAAAARILSRAGRTEAAEAACAAGLAETPDDIDLLREHAMLAVRRGDWTEALDRWLDAERRLPNSPKVKTGLNTVRLQLAQFEPPAPGVAQSETALFFGRFESLGGTAGGCEFGMVQRQYGSSALGLLRWSNVPSESLLRGLDHAFEGVGLPENTALRTARITPTREEYMIRENTYGFGAHTFIETRDVPEDKMLAQTAKRLAFLRNKLVEEMRTGKKTFVYKFAAQVEDAMLLELGAALARLGPGRLLCAVKADAMHPKGTLRQLNGHVFAAHLGHFMSDAAGESRGIDFAAWHDVCTRAASLSQAAA